MEDINLTEEEKRDIKKSQKLFFFAVLIAVLGFGGLVAVSCVEERISDWVFWTILIVIVGIEIFAIWLMCKAAPELIGYEAVKKCEKTEKRKLFQLTGMSRSVVEKSLEKQKFKKIEGGYYWKKKFCLSKDYIQYYVKIINCADPDAATDKEIDRFNSLEKKGKNGCLILLFYLDNPDETLWDSIKSMGISYLVDESVMPTETSATIVPVGVDISTGTARFMDVSRGIHISLYAHGCKMLKKLADIS